MTSKSVARRISAIRHVAPAGPRSSESPLGLVALFIVFTLAILLMGATISAAQVLQ